MYRLLIVDDEKQIRNGLQKILNWEEYGIQICAEAADGRQALALIEEWKPQILLTDIKMPELDGIALLHEIRKCGLETKTIVLSGYDDFTLVRQAMKYGAVDYLLKPIGKQELIQAIEELLDQLEETQYSDSGQQEGLAVARNSFLNRLISNSVSAIEFREKTELLEIDLGKQRLAVVRLANYMKSPEDKIARAEAVKMAEVCQNYLEKQGIGTAFVSTGGEVIMFLTGIGETRDKVIYKEQLKGLYDILGERFLIQMYMSVSKPVKSYRNLASAYEEAENTLRYIFIFEEAEILYAEEIDEYFRNNETQAVILQNEIEELVEGGNMDMMEAYLDTVFGSSQSIPKGADYYVFRNMAMEVLIYFYHFLMVQMSADRVRINEEKTTAMQKLIEIRNLESMKLYLKEVFSDVSRQYHKYMSTPHNRLVEEVLRKVKERYMDIDLSLQYLAEELNSNTAYLGRLFKKEVGSSFADYLNWYRIEKAEALLKETNLKGSELCEKVGFSNYNYFYVVFKKLKGKKPTEVRGNF